MAGTICPKCGSNHLFINENKGFSVCLDCGDKFMLQEMPVQKTWNQGLTGEAYWCREFCLEAPVSLALSYQRLYDYVEEGNIGCTLFLIRDVFELMIKIPVIIMFNGVHELAEKAYDIQGLMMAYPAVRKLYDHSFQMLVTGKWFECLRVIGGIKNEAIFEPMYQETIRYCRQIKDLFCFNHTSMVTWRNRTVGHSCLAVVPESNYKEIPDILKMFRRVAMESLSFYRSIAFADHSGSLLKGSHVQVSTRETLIAYEDANGIHYEKMNALVTGHLSNLAFYDGYDRGRAYLLDYHTGDRYKDTALSGRLRHIQNRTRINFMDDYQPSENIDEDNLKSEDIRALENKLQAHSDIVYIPFLYEWLMKHVKAHKSGILMLQAERGMGKSTFADTLDQLSLSGQVLRYSDDIAGWNSFMQEETAIRVWHLNASYSSRRDILLEGIRNILLTIEPAYHENGIYYPPNRLTGVLDAAYSRLQTMDDSHLLKLSFADCLNQTLKAYEKYTSREKLILVLDGIDEMPDASILLDMLPEPELLSDGVYLLLTCRMNHELKAKKSLCEGLEHLNCFGRMMFGFDAIEEYDGELLKKISGNPYYYSAVKQYLADFISEEVLASGARGMSDICYDGQFRFSTLSAYKKLYRMNPSFTGSSNGHGLLGS
ncbi:MAG: TFIIB-type zinc ribbon-containing protein, partial [Coprococcus sp.]